MEDAKIDTLRGELIKCRELLAVFAVLVERQCEAVDDCVAIKQEYAAHLRALRDAREAAEDSPASQRLGENEGDKKRRDDDAEHDNEDSKAIHRSNVSHSWRWIC